MYQYPLELHTEPTGVWLSCPDVPEMNASGDTLGEAFAEALNGLESALSLYVEQRRKIPAASPAQDPALVLRLPALTVAKIMLWNAMCDEGVSRAELARRLGVSRQMVDRLVDFLHASKIEQVERALGLLGRRLSLVLEAA
ncbi:type II toxin-antitoxin system HicB family antitoxin (plasmid) [Pseudomonas sp. HN2]|uniref:type II toxin-antitoxin system HicB family antitoxin n=1 Tax=Pseudomonas sp. HN2 TaxID=2884805 RepID=UPI001D149BA2|nr:type II toxin-antitoxin system HicB family antitoxin [Pseudomonas sp. HN2]UEB98691.1 type II toxin-antitoxin system HicB family antitoxin [Pseudomonas sp. HN2]UEB98747.1 type II toxin-antitoxin system HicB family antitoxin [Pseudomonas sp. HN2]